MKQQMKGIWFAKLLTFIMIISVCSVGNINITVRAAAIPNFQISGTYQQTEARTMLAMINSFRIGGDAWYWNETDMATV